MVKTAQAETYEYGLHDYNSRHIKLRAFMRRDFMAFGFGLQAGY